jgi:ubiquinone/menaquinone biosynthesis C-methylase UbiE
LRGREQGAKRSKEAMATRQESKGAKAPEWTQRALIVLFVVAATLVVGAAAGVQVRSEQKISDMEGNFQGVLDDDDSFGISVAALGDLDGDKTADVAVGANRDDDGRTDRGAVYVLFLHKNGTVKAEQKISDTQGNFQGVLDDYDYFGVSVAALGDLDGDKTADVAVDKTQPVTLQRVREGGKMATAAATPLESVRPGINKDFDGTEMTGEDFLVRFEVEDREIFAKRDELVELAGDLTGRVVADVGCGTGCMMPPLARAVGAKGKVFLLDTAAEKFRSILEERAAGLREQEKGALAEISVLQNEPTSLPLPDSSVDCVFLIDAYHHVEFPSVFMADARRVLRPAGRLFVVDFEKIEGVSSEWVMGHVRAGKQEVVEELKSFGFTLEKEHKDVLQKNWVGVFSTPAE